MAGTLRLTSTKIDDEWSSGEAGMLVRAHASGTLSFDNFKIGYDDNVDGDIADADDDIQIDDDFSSNVLTLVHDHAGNLTDDGVLLYTYDAWNRLVAARRRVDAQTPVATYEYDGLNRRIRKVVACSGEGIVPGSDAGGIDGIQAGDLNEHYYYAGWRVIEERDNSANTLAQTVYGTEYIDAPVCRDRNTDVTAGGSPDDDCLDSGGSARGAVATTVRVPTFAIENRRSFARIRTSPRMRANSRHPGASRITSSPHPAPTPYDP